MTVEEIIREEGEEWIGEITLSEPKRHPAGYRKVRNCP